MYNTTDFTDITAEKIFTDYFFEQCKDLISVKDVKGKYIECNKAFLKFFGLDKNNVLGKNINEIIICSDFDKNCIDAINNEDSYILTHKKDINTERNYIDKNGENHWFRIKKVPVFYNNKIKGIMTVEQNINAEKLSENRKDLFISTIIHDLKNPLISLIYSLQRYKKIIENSVTQEQIEIYNLIIDSALYMKNLIYSILKIYKENQGIIKLNKQHFNFEELIYSCNSEADAFAQDKGINIKFTSFLKETEKIFYADNIQLKRVLSNLLNNAINYAFKNTEITIELKKDINKFIYSIQSYGSAIDENLKNCIFEKYTCGKNIESNGLGLYFCKKVIDTHEGNIYLESDKTSNKFVFELPILDEKYACLDQIVL